MRSGTGPARDALEGKQPQRRPQQLLDRRLEEVAKAVEGGYCRLQMPLRLALGVRGTVAGHRLGALERGGGGTSPPSSASLGPAAWHTQRGTARDNASENVAQCSIVLGAGAGPSVRSTHSRTTTTTSVTRSRREWPTCDRRKERPVADTGTTERVASGRGGWDIH